MRASEIKEAAEALVKAEVIYADDPGRFEGHKEKWEAAYKRHNKECQTCDGCTKDSMAVYFAFQRGAEWMQTQLRNQIKIAMGALWDEDEITGSLWLGSTAICLIKAALNEEGDK